jgi:hypothetical protein
MPIFVEWKWQENTRSFIVIFHFIDDYTKSNLRITKTGFWVDILKEKSVRNKAWMTWAPSHVELAMLADLLHIANIVDGLQDSIKRKLRRFLDGSWQTTEEAKEWLQVFPEGVKAWIPPTEDLPLVAQLCEEYIEYLNKVVKPYINKQNRKR